MEVGKYILSVYSPFSDRAGLPLHDTPFPGVLMKRIGATFFDRMPFLTSIVSHGNRNTDYVTTRDSTPPSGHPRYENTYRRPDVYTQSNNDRTYSDSRNFDQHRVRTVNDHTNYRNYTQRYNDRFVNKHHNQRQNNAVSSTYASKQKN